MDFKTIVEKLLYNNIDTKTLKQNIRGIKIVMEYQEEFIDLLNDIEDGIEDKATLLEYKNFIKNNLLEGTELVQKINLISTSDPNYEVFKETVDDLSNSLVKIHNIDRNIFKEILLYSGFNLIQIDAFSKGIESSENKVEEMTNLLAESYFKGINILQNPNSKKMMSRTSYVENSGNIFSEFLEYILEDVLPAQAMENIAKFSIYQRIKLDKLIKNDPRLKDALENFKNGNTISDIDKKYISKKITEDMSEMFQIIPIYKFRNNIGYVEMKREQGHINPLIQTAGRNRPDAYGLDENGMLYVATVTSNTNFETQNNQSIEWANYIQNGINIGKLKTVNDFKVLICCNPILNELDEKGTLFKGFRREIQKLEQDKIINYDDIQSLKRLAIDAEILSIFKNVSLDKYQNLKDKLEFSVLGEEFIIIPKEMNEQYKECIKNLEVSLKVLNKIITNNPTLDKMQTAFKFLVQTVSEGGYNGNNSYLKRNQEIDDPEIYKITKSITKLTSLLKNNLLENGHDSHKLIKTGVEGFFGLKKSADGLNLRYKNEKENIVNLKISIAQDIRTNAELERIKKGTHTCTFDYSAYGRSLISQIAALTYNKGNIPDSLINDALIFQAGKIHNRFHLKSLATLVTGIKNVYESDLPYDLTRTLKHVIKYNLHGKVSKSLDEKNKVIFESNILEIENKIKLRKNKLSS